MSLNDVTFDRTIGGLGRVSPSEDHVSGMLFYEQDTSGEEEISSIEELSPKFTPYSNSGESNAKNILYYHVSEFFRMNPSGKLFVKYVASGDRSTDYSEIKELQFKSGRKLRQLGVYDPEIDLGETDPGSHTQIAWPSLQSLTKTLNTEEHAPLSMMIQGKFTGTLSQLSDLSGKESRYISVLIGESATGQASAIKTNLKDNNLPVGCLGTALGTLSKALVHENIAWVQKFNIAGGEYDVPGFINGDRYDEVTKSDLDDLNTNRYIFAIKHTGDPGTYFNDSHTATKAVDDYAYIENNRTIDKAIRNIRTSLLPQLNSPLRVDREGYLFPDTVKYFENLVKKTLDQMRNDGELSDYAIGIDPYQRVLETSELVISTRLVPRGIARSIDVKIGFATNAE
ncbi:DUF2586 family protein [Aureibacter tunicatorum]|uniref:Tail sheath protein n=1 Tax=Aureibacter tunicatorum TaxID=866807 RepID=A0AAE3XUJ3_9BACT|nr:DUF2586 family protein [Aureibacter tunicatorum]MDR6241969.1 hypothetical protein [Aureibacter tunicatorum]BDD07522.1 hypothetical protein AUTU_50050 [Aureibacter tunicatorum]